MYNDKRETSATTEDLQPPLPTLKGIKEGIQSSLLAMIQSEIDIYDHTVRVGQTPSESLINRIEKLSKAVNNLRE